MSWIAVGIRLRFLRVSAAFACLLVLLASARALAQDGDWIPNAEERELLRLINETREAEGLEPVTLDATLSKVARAHAAEMIRLEYFSHVSPTTGSPGNRVREAGVAFRFVGENLAGHPSVEKVHRAFLKSRSHRQNILREDVRLVGLAHVPGGPYGAMIVEVFVAPAEESAAARPGEGPGS